MLGGATPAAAIYQLFGVIQELPVRHVNHRFFYDHTGAAMIMSYSLNNGSLLHNHVTQTARGEVFNSRNSSKYVGVAARITLID
jgi:hypothetical protein